MKFADEFFCNTSVILKLLLPVFMKELSTHIPTQLDYGIPFTIP